MLEVLSAIKQMPNMVDVMRKMLIAHFKFGCFSKSISVMSNSRHRWLILRKPSPIIVAVKEGLSIVRQMPNMNEDMSTVMII